MNKRPLLFWLLASFLLVALLAVGVLSMLTVSFFRSYSQAVRQTALETRARTLAQLLPPSLPAISPDSLQSLLKLFRDRDERITVVVATTGSVIADTHVPAGSESVTHLPEIRSALAGTTAVARRYSSEVRHEMLFVATPLWHEGTVIAAVRMGAPCPTVTGNWRSLAARLFAGSALLLAVATAVAALLSRRFSRSIHRLLQGVQRFTAGDFSRKLDAAACAELEHLAAACNEMAEQLDRKVRTLTRHHNEQEAILRSLRESVLAVDRDERILFLNRAAGELFEVEPTEARGRLVHEIARASELQQFIRDLLSGDASFSETEVQLGPSRVRIFQVCGTELVDASGVRIGFVIVLNDITRLRQLERVRREFVANVSHELRTPIAAIQGFAETLIENAGEDRATTQAFLERIARNADRLNAIIDDLLALARLEQEEEQIRLGLMETSLHAIAAAAISACAAQAEQHSVPISLEGPEHVLVRAKPRLLEQAIVNLLTNAIQHSEPGSPVKVEIERTNGEVALHVRDRGCGIAAEHLPRLFERFYRVDRARSRSRGGTGLGLAIVKHIVQSHDGRVTVESTPGYGSTFTIYLPAV